jgi:hypothetical protein
MVHTMQTKNTSGNKLAMRPSRSAHQASGLSRQEDRWASLARAVLFQAVDDAARGERIEFEDLRAWAVVARLPLYEVRRAIQRASEATPLTAA